jgi:hypothetical protein
VVRGNLCRNDGGGDEVRILRSVVMRLEETVVDVVR